MIVYVYTFPNGKKYVGQTINSLSQRSGYQGYRYKGQAVYNAIQKYGWDNIQKEIYECQTEEEMDALEQELIAIYNTQNENFGYNRDSGGSQGRHPSKEVIEKIRQANIGKILSEETKQKIRRSSVERGSKTVICVETGEEYESCVAAARAVEGADRTAISRCCNRRPNTTSGGFHWRFK